MTHSIDTLSSNALLPNNISDVEKISLSREELDKLDIDWSVHSYFLKEKNKSILHSRIIQEPITDRITWEKNAIALILFLSDKLIYSKDLKKSPQILSILSVEGLKTTTISERIKAGLDLHKKSKKYLFLKAFVDITNAKILFEKNDSLEEKNQEILKKIIGNKETFRILQILGDDKKLLKFIKIILKIKKIQKRKISIKHFEKKIFDDKKFIIKQETIKEFYKKIKNNEKSQSVNSFRYFLSEEVYGKKGYFYINDNSPTLPNLSKISKGTELEKIEVFYQWLRTNLINKIKNDEKLIDFVIACLSFNAFAIADNNLRNTFSSIFDIDPKNIRWKFTPKFGSRYFVNKNDRNEIEITQMRKYILVQPPKKATETKDTTLGGMDIHWKIKINDKTKILSAKIFCQNITFRKNCSLFKRKRVLNLMDIKKLKDLKNSLD